MVSIDKQEERVLVEKGRKRWWQGDGKCLITITLGDRTKDFRKQSWKIGEWMLVVPAPSGHDPMKASLTALHAEVY